MRLTGRYDQKKLDTSVKGMRVTKMDLLGKMTGASGSPAPESSEPGLADSPPAPAPAAAAPTPRLTDSRGNGDAAVMEPGVPRDLIDRMRKQRVAFDAARKEVDSAAEVYADALYAAGEDNKVDPAISARLQRAEAQMAEIQRGVPALANEARAAGVSEDLIELYERSAGMSH